MKAQELLLQIEELLQTINQLNEQIKSNELILHKLYKFLG